MPMVFELDVYQKSFLLFVVYVKPKHSLRLEYATFDVTRWRQTFEPAVSEGMEIIFDLRTYGKTLKSANIIEEYAHACAEAVKRLGELCNHFEIWSEPQCPVLTGSGFVRELDRLGHGGFCVERQ